MKMISKDELLQQISENINETYKDDNQIREINLDEIDESKIPF